MARPALRADPRPVHNIPFPLYHGTSSHFRDLFEVGGTTRPWPHVQDAISLLRATWAQLQGFGIEPGWYQANILRQSTGPSNWQHGELYAAAGETAAVSYARSGAAFGGEILTQCAEALKQLKAMDPASAAGLWAQYPALGRFLAGGGTPLLVIVEDVPVSALSNEAGEGSVDEQVREVEGYLSEMEGNLLQVYLHDYQFRVRAGYGTVREIVDLGA